MNLKSSVNSVGKVVTQIYHFESGHKRTIKHILTETIEQGEFTKYKRVDGSMVHVDGGKLELFETFEEPQATVENMELCSADIDFLKAGMSIKKNPYGKKAKPFKNYKPKYNFENLKPI